MRYVVRPRSAYWDDDAEAFVLSPESCVVVEREQMPEPTGLLDLYGNELFRVPEPRKIGFVKC